MTSPSLQFIIVSAFHYLLRGVIPKVYSTIESGEGDSHKGEEVLVKIFLFVRI